MSWNSKSNGTKFMRMPLLIACVTIFSSVFAMASAGIPWDSANNPRNFPTVRNLHFDSLPLSGTATVKPWAGYHWPARKGGIAYQWQQGKRASVNNLKSYSQVQSMSWSEKQRLSPSEKLDILLGDFNYGITKWVLRNNPSNSEKWSGICEGTAMASMLFQQPSPIRMRNTYGQEIPLYTSDLKAFTSWYMARVHKSRIYWVGKRCEQTLRNDPCWDVNPGAFHAILTNHIGINKQVFLMDNTKTREVWNYPVYNFRSTILERKNMPYGHMRYRIRTTLQHGGSVQPHTGTISSDQNAKWRNFEYFVDVNDRGEIYGGQWVSNKHPDFVWYKPFQRFQGRLEFLNQVIKKAN